jgi:hypothetical protein
MTPFRWEVMHRQTYYTDLWQFRDFVLAKTQKFEIGESVKNAIVELSRVLFRVHVSDFEIGQTRNAKKLEKIKL